NDDEFPGTQGRHELLLPFLCVPKDRHLQAERQTVDHSTSATSSTSTANPNGNSLTPMAVLAWRPASPKTCTNRSEAPLATAGCCVKPAALLTKTPTRTSCLTES